MPDQQITCTTCGQRFAWSVGEQEFYRERGLQARDHFKAGELRVALNFDRCEA